MLVLVLIEFAYRKPTAQTLRNCGPKRSSPDEDVTFATIYCVQPHLFRAVALTSSCRRLEVKSSTAKLWVTAVLKSSKMMMHGND